jgi:hypothetical protein
MSPAKFPDRRPDGSFCVVVGLRTSPDGAAELADRVRRWMTDVWMPSHPTWTREWKTGVDLARAEKQVLSYADEFSSDPEVSGEGSELRLRLRGKRDSRFWKDWLVSRIAPDLRAEFPELSELLYIRDCDE